MMTAQYMVPEAAAYAIATLVNGSISMVDYGGSGLAYLMLLTALPNQGLEAPGIFSNLAVPDSIEALHRLEEQRYRTQ